MKTTNIWIIRNQRNHNREASAHTETRARDGRTTAFVHQLRNYYLKFFFIMCELLFVVSRVLYGCCLPVESICCCCFVVGCDWLVCSLFLFFFLPVVGCSLLVVVVLSSLYLHFPLSLSSLCCWVSWCRFFPSSMSCVCFKCLRFCAISVGIIIILKFLFDRYFSVCDSRGKRESSGSKRSWAFFFLAVFGVFVSVELARRFLCFFLLLWVAVGFFLVVFVRHIDSHSVGCVCVCVSFLLLFSIKMPWRKIVDVDKQFLITHSECCVRLSDPAIIASHTYNVLLPTEE